MLRAISSVVVIVPRDGASSFGARCCGEASIRMQSCSICISGKIDEVLVQGPSSASALIIIHPI
jgi:hypothetical protein